MIITLVVPLRPVYASVSQDLPNTVWEKHFADDHLEYEYKMASLSGSNEIWLVVGTRPKGKLGGLQSLFLWKIDKTTGKKISEFNGKIFAKNKKDKKDKKDKDKTGDITYTKIHALTVMQDGDIFLVLEYSDHHVSLIKISKKDGTPLFVKQIEESNHSMMITKIIPVKDHHYLFIGRNAGMPLLMKLDNSGNIIWKKTVVDADISLFMDGLSFENGGYALLGSQLSSPEKTNVWIGKFDADGNLLGEIEFPGRFGSIAGDEAGGLVVVSDQRDSGGWDILVRKFDMKLEQSWEVKILSEVNTLAPFRISGLPDGSFILTGTNESMLWVSRIKATGEIIWDHIHRDRSAQWEKLWNFDLASSDSEIIIPYTMLTVDSKGEQRQVVKIIKLDFAGKENSH